MVWALPTRIGLRIAAESPNGYSDGRNRWPSGECRLGGLLQQWTFNEVGNYTYSFPQASLTGGGLHPTLDLVMEARLRIINIQGGSGADSAHRYGPRFEDTGSILLGHVRMPVKIIFLFFNVILYVALLIVP